VKLELPARFASPPLTLYDTCVPTSGDGTVAGSREARHREQASALAERDRDREGGGWGLGREREGRGWGGRERKKQGEREGERIPRISMGTKSRFS
jgi:hypothetical protein